MGRYGKDAAVLAWMPLAGYVALLGLISWRRRSCRRKRAAGTWTTYAMPDRAPASDSRRWQEAARAGNGKQRRPQ